MEVAAGAMSPLLRKLGELLVGEFNLRKQVKKGVESLKTELALMQATLLKVGEVSSDQLDTDVRIWASKVRDLSYDMEDAVDSFLVHMEDGHDNKPTDMKNRVKKFLKKTTKLFSKGKTLHQISNAIQEAQELAKELTDLRKRYNLEMHSTNLGAKIDPRLINMYKDVTELVGVEEARDELIQRLTEGDEGSKLLLKTISIVGFGGLGKTTLAKAVYDRIKVQFNCSAFVSVSRTPDMKKVLKDVMYELDKAKFKDIHRTKRNEDLLIRELRGFLEDKRYLIVIDDIWDEEAWGVIKCALSENSLGSRLITTTRNASVAKACRSSSDHMIHAMEPLSDKDSQRLFYKRIFHSEMGCPDELQEVSRDILKKCGGVPLAIIAIASLLASSQGIKPKDQWCRLLKSIGRGLAEGGAVKDMKRILSFSYYDLPSYLKPCLLYLSIFPEDYEIEREILIWRWIAEGFIHPGKQETSLFELGESYFNELVNRSMIQPIHEGYEDMPYACRVHDMVLDLICCLSSEDNFVSIFDGIRRSIHDSQSKVRRLSLQNSSMTQRNTHQLGTTSMSQVRSVSLFVPAIDLMPSLSRFEVLRVLDLDCCDLSGREDKIGLEHLGNLLHLRYLGLRGTYIGHLPLEIGKLQFLQTLDIIRTGIRDLPLSVVRLRQLMRLRVDYDAKVPTGLGNLVSLEELGMLDVSRLSQDDFQKLGSLTELRVLRICFDELNESQNKVLAESIGNMHKLQSLSFQGTSVLTNVCIDFMLEGWVPPPQLHTSIMVDMWFSMLPKWINHASLPLLSRLEIRVDEAQWEDIQILGKLPALRYLWLRVCGSMEERAVELGFVVTADAFPCLRVCEFINFVTAPSMFPRGAMPMLQYLRFECRAQDIASGGLDVSMGHLPSLEEVTVHLYCEEASDGEVEAAEGVLRHAAEAHPNRPTLISTLGDSEGDGRDQDGIDLQAIWSPTTSDGATESSTMPAVPHLKLLISLQIYILLHVNQLLASSSISAFCFNSRTISRVFRRYLRC